MEWTHEHIAEEQKKVRLNILKERYLDVELRAELLRRESVRKEEVMEELTDTDRFLQSLHSDKLRGELHRRGWFIDANLGKDKCEHLTDEDLKAEIAKREEAKKQERPEPIYSPSPGNSLYALFEDCERYLDYLDSNATYQSLYWRARIYQKAIECIYGDKGWEWIYSKARGKGEI